jgi:flap endonuclease-1
MGIAIGSLIKEYKKDIDLKNLKYKKIGFDAYNVLYQFVTTIRGSDGLPLKNKNQEITSHINGLFYRITNLIKYGIKPLFVFDGISNKLKEHTKEERRIRRDLAREKYNLAIEQKDILNINKYGKQSATINLKIIDESKELLDCLGVPYFIAPSEAEAQISVMVKNNYLDYVASQDYDCFLFGSPHLLKNVSVSAKRKIVSKNIYVENLPCIINAKDIYNNLKIDRIKLIWLSILIGTDFNNKVAGIGPKTALKLVQENNKFENIIDYLKTKNKIIDFDYKTIENIFLNPNVSTNPKIIQNKFNRTKLEDLLINKYDFDKLRVKNYLDNFIKEKENTEKQKNITRWF